MGAGASRLDSEPTQQCTVLAHPELWRRRWTIVGPEARRGGHRATLEAEFLGCRWGTHVGELAQIGAQPARSFSVASAQPLAPRAPLHGLRRRLEVTQTVEVGLAGQAVGR